MTRCSGLPTHSGEDRKQHNCQKEIGERSGQKHNGALTNGQLIERVANRLGCDPLGIARQLVLADKFHKTAKAGSS